MEWLLLGGVVLALFAASKSSGGASAPASPWVPWDPTKDFSPGLYRLTMVQAPEDGFVQGNFAALAADGWGISATFPAGSDYPSDWPDHDAGRLRFDLYTQHALAALTPDQAKALAPYAVRFYKRT